jgi:hypothetical protein
MSQSNDSNQETTTTTTTATCATNVDKTLLEYIQTTILQIKKDRVQCNVKSIFHYLKQHYADYEAVQTLNEKELMKKLDVGVRDGILSRKFGGSKNSISSGGDNSRPQPLPPPPPPPPLPPPPPSLSEAGASVVATATSSQQKLSNETFKLPNIRVPINDNADTNLDDYKRLINGILSILIKAVFYLSNGEGVGGGGGSSGASSLDAICKYLYESYTFETVAVVTDNEIQQNDEDNMARLKACVRYLLKKKEKIFIVRCGNDAGNNDDGQIMYAFNAAYLQHKIENEENQRPSPHPQPSLISNVTTTMTTNTNQPKLTLSPPKIVNQE